MNFDTGDIIFVKGGIVAGATWGKFSHVCLAFDNKQTFETHLKWGKAGFHSIEQYRNSDRVEVWRFNGLAKEQKQHIQELCHKYKGTPYSLWDCVVKGALTFLHPKLSGWISAKLGDKKFAECNEITMRILWEALAFEPFRDYEAYTPNEMQVLVKQWPSRLTRVWPV